MLDAAPPDPVARAALRVARVWRRRRWCSGRWPSTSPCRRTAGLLLAGDAAGFIDPMTGDGMRLALAGAELAAEVADAVLRGELDAAAAPAVLARRRRAAFAGKWRFNRARARPGRQPRGARRGGRPRGSGRGCSRRWCATPATCGPPCRRPWRRRDPRGQHRAWSRRSRSLLVMAGEAALSAPQRRRCCVARGAVEPADDVYRHRCSGPTRSGSR